MRKRQEKQKAERLDAVVSRTKALRDAVVRSSAKSEFRTMSQEVCKPLWLKRREPKS